MLDKAVTTDPPTYPPFPELLPAGVIDHGRYRIRFARSWNELDAIQALRFDVFNLEMGEGLETSWSRRRDEDPFDACCHHLLVEERSSGRVVGTYRMQTRAMAAAGRGFYSSGEYDLDHLPESVIEASIEVGRACIERVHRNRQVLFLLWKGLAVYLEATGCRFLFGCCSLPTEDPVEGYRVHRHLIAAGRVHPEIVVAPHRPLAGPSVVDPGEGPVEIPTLFRTYLRYGAWVCGAPTLDPDFKTIDFLVLFDVEAMEPRSRRLFFDE